MTSCALRLVAAVSLLSCVCVALQREDVDAFGVYGGDDPADPGVEQPLSFEQLADEVLDEREEAEKVSNTSK